MGFEILNNSVDCEIQISSLEDVVNLAPHGSQVTGSRKEHETPWFLVEDGQSRWFQIGFWYMFIPNFEELIRFDAAYSSKWVEKNRQFLLVMSFQ